MNYYEQIKEELINNEVYKKVKDYSKNRSDLNAYYNVGKLIIDAQGGEDKSEYGNRLISEYSYKLTKELGRGNSKRNLYNMRLFYLRFKDYNILQAMTAKLNWSHFSVLLQIKDINKMNYYIKITEEQNLPYRELQKRVKLNEYERLDDSIKQKLISKEENKIEDFIKNPIVIKNTKISEKVSEKLLKQLIFEDLDNFLLELGQGFTYIRNEYKIKVGDRYNYIDLLLFNIEYNCYVVVELKVTELKAEHIGQIKKYMGYIDKNIKKVNQDKTIGIIICKKGNEFVMEYCSDNRIFETTYVLK